MLLFLLNKHKIKTVDFRNNKQTIIYSTKRKTDFWNTRRSWKERSKKMKKGVDKAVVIWYYIGALQKHGARRTLKIKQRLMKRNPWILIWEVLSSTTVILVKNEEKMSETSMSDWALRMIWIGQEPDLDKIFREFDPGSGWTLAACLTHASRTELLWNETSVEWNLSLVADGWVTRE